MSLFTSYQDTARTQATCRVDKQLELRLQPAKQMLITFDIGLKFNKG